jgi:phenylacetate-CoA ligase
MKRLHALKLVNEKDVSSYQLKELRKIFKHTYNTVPYYKKLIDNSGLNVTEEITMENYYKLPLLDKELLINNTKSFVSNSFEKKELVLAKTGGTTGTSLKFCYAKKTLAKEFAFVYWKSRSGYDFNQRHATFNGRFIVPLEQKSPPFWRRNWAINQTLYSSYHLSENNLKYYYQDIKRTKPIFIVGYPSNLYILANYMIENKCELDNYPEKIFTSSETLNDKYRNIIENAFKCKVSDLYGQGEKVSMIYQCKYGNYHFVSEYGINELINTNETELTISGELVSTGFINYATPLIRYKTGDYITISKIKKCSCGEIGPVIESIDGRVEDIIHLNDGRKIGRLSNFIFLEESNIKEAQIIQNSIDSLLFKLVVRDSYTKQDEYKLLESIQKYIGRGMSIELIYTDKIDREKNGKFRSVICRINKNA